MREQLVNLSGIKKRILALLLDTLFIWLSLYLVLSVRYGFSETRLNVDLLLKLCVLSPLIILPVYIRQGLYRAVLRYMGLDVPFTILRATVFGVVGVVIASFLLGIQIPRSLPFLFSGILTLLICLTRYMARYWLVGYRLKDMLLYTFNIPDNNTQSKQGVPVAVYGAGAAGCQLVSALGRGREYKPVVFIDEDTSLEGRTVLGLQVFNPKKIGELINAGMFEKILLAIPSATEQRRKEIIRSLEDYPVPVLTMPAFCDLASGKLRIQDIQEVQIDDLLGREAVEPVGTLLYRCVKKQNVMVTGAGGSIGSELCRQISELGCKSLILFDHSEYNLYKLDRELCQQVEYLRLDINIVSVLGSVNDPSRLLDVMSAYQIDTVYHAAAYKHVPIVEQNIAEGIRNNLIGTIYTAQAAMVSNVKNFVLVSTDKAVRPSNIMGATKRMAELVLQAYSELDDVDLFHSILFGNAQTIKNNTRFTMVRFGNVLGSSGSVIPLFKQQIAAGGPVTVTHPEINRFFMTIPEASQLVIQAGSMGEGGDVFVLDMGKPVKIVDLAKRMIKLSGYSLKDDGHPDGDIAIEFTGLRSGEKLYEELLIGDIVNKTQHPRIFRATEEKLPWHTMVTGIENILESIRVHNYDVTRTLLTRYATGFKPNSELADLLYDISKGNQDNIVPFNDPQSAVGEVACSNNV